MNPADQVRAALRGLNDATVRESFETELKPEMARFEQAAIVAYGDWLDFDKAYSADKDSGTVVGFLFQVVARLTMSANLLQLGHLALSGAAFRQSQEALAAAFVMADYAAPYRKQLWAGEFAVHKAAGLFEKQAATDPALNLEAVRALTRIRSFYNGFSHPSLLAMSDTILLDSGGHTIGASFDRAKIPFYRKEIDSRSGFAEMLPNAMDGVSLRMQRWPAFGGPG